MITFFRLSLPLLAALLMPLAEAGVRPDAIYGADDRRDWYQVADGHLRDWASSTAALIYWSDLKQEGDSFRISATKYGQAEKLCTNQPFWHQPTAAQCTGFLVGPNLMVTAGHCIESAADCRKSAFVFDYAVTDPRIFPGRAEAKNVYACRRIVARANRGEHDYAVVEVDRTVSGRNPLPIRRRGTPARGTAVTMIGHPAGLPSKIADGGVILGTSPLTASVDAFAGNSGSPVINRSTGLVEGILVNGSEDFIRSGKCYIEYRCGNCRGEDLFPIHKISGYIP